MTVEGYKLDRTFLRQVEMAVAGGQSSPHACKEAGITG